MTPASCNSCDNAKGYIPKASIHRGPDTWATDGCYFVVMFTVVLCWPPESDSQAPPRGQASDQNLLSGGQAIGEAEGIRLEFWFHPGEGREANLIFQSLCVLNTTR